MSRPYRVFETADFNKDLDNLPEELAGKMRQKLKGHVYPQLSQRPHFGSNIKKLTAYEPPTWRYRIGDYRLFFTIDDKDKIILMLSISDRKDAY